MNLSLKKKILFFSYLLLLLVVSESVAQQSVESDESTQFQDVQDGY
jgi:hypothetical protein